AHRLPLRDLGRLAPLLSPIGAEAEIRLLVCRLDLRRHEPGIAGFHQPTDLAGFGVSINQRRVPDGPRLSFGTWPQRDGLIPGLAEIAAEPARACVEQYVSLSQVAQTRTQSRHRLAVGLE